MATDVVFDLETSGFSPFEASVWEIGAVAAPVGAAVPEAPTPLESSGLSHFDVLMKTPVPLSGLVQRLTNMSNATLQQKGVSAREGWLRFLLWLRTLPKPLHLIGHNIINFDLPFLFELSLRFGDTDILFALSISSVTDTLVKCRALKKAGALGGASLKLGLMYSTFCGHEMSGAHRASADAYANLQFFKTERFQQLVKRGCDGGQTTLAAVFQNFLARRTRLKNLEYRVHNGVCGICGAVVSRFWKHSHVRGSKHGPASSRPRVAAVESSSFPSNHVSLLPQDGKGLIKTKHHDKNK